MVSEVWEGDGVLVYPNLFFQMVERIRMLDYT